SRGLRLKLPNAAGKEFNKTKASKQLLKAAGLVQIEQTANQPKQSGSGE
ncbi:MAG: hypothetical protein QOG92_2135, partial [Verrucomicrobiota bacterium]|nr:hypothetical protein [Verrucomicrobiota bacterium]